MIAPLSRRLQDRLLGLELKDQENKKMLQYLEYLCEEELKGMDQINLKKRHLREDLDKCLADNVRKRATTKEQDKLLNEKVQQQRKEEDVRILYNITVRYYITLTITIM